MLLLFCDMVADVDVSGFVGSVVAVILYGVGGSDFHGAAMVLWW